MPKLQQSKIDERKRLLEDAALTLFRARGFHGVGLRQIADEAGVSMGNIYNYYESKEQIFSSLLERLHADFSGPETPLAGYLRRCGAPPDLEELGRVVRRMVNAHRDYLTLIYVDIAEFEGRHVRSWYEELLSRFRVALGDRLGPTPSGGVDPVVGFTLAYMQFFNFFIVERMIGARGHLGLSEAAAIRAMASTFRRGLAPEEDE